MAAAWRSAATICKNSMCARPHSVFKTLARRPILSSARPIPYPASRHASVLGSVESMLPLHSTVAIARLKSNIAADTAFWSWLSQGALDLSISLVGVNAVPYLVYFCNFSSGHEYGVADGFSIVKTCGVRGHHSPKYWNEWLYLEKLKPYDIAPEIIATAHKSTIWMFNL